MNPTILPDFLKENKIDAVLATSVANITYLTNYSGFSPLEREAFMIITEKNQHLITDGRYMSAVRDLSHNLKLHEITSATKLTHLLEEIITSEKIQTLGFESDNLTVAEYVKIKKLKTKLKSISLNNLRIIKTPEEIKKIKASCDIACITLEKVKKYLKPGMTEKGVAFLLEIEVKKAGAELSFPTIVAFTENAATPHHMTSDRILKQNDSVLIDCGVKFDNYCSDMTRTFAFGKPTREFEKMYSVVEIAQQNAIDYINNNCHPELVSGSKISIKASEVDKVARDYITSQGYPTIPHSLGHGIGIEVHEAPRLSPTSKDILEEGMVFSIEPGIYLPASRHGFPELGGVRIEDLFTIQNNELHKLT